MDDAHKLAQVGTLRCRPMADGRCTRVGLDNNLSTVGLVSSLPQGVHGASVRCSSVGPATTPVHHVPAATSAFVG
ncbi:hypothetical protein XMIN_452 [Xanthomonas citri pv. mangiferaeindicae LMG 941]|nr:hypothetical protein XMIN_452 [Xanthomonas citri pv. mangiferaeindicae LMG 941]